MHPAGDGVLHRSGFSWTAAIAFPLWALTHRLYKTALVSSVGILIVSQLGPFLFGRIDNATLRALVAIGYLLGYAVTAVFLAGRWHRHVLERSGYFLSAAELAEPDDVQR